MRRITGVVLAGCLLLPLSGVLALTPSQVLIVANANSPESVELAKYYAQQRGIPLNQVVTVNCTTAPTMTREEFDQHVRMPLRQHILGNAELQRNIQALCLVWGMPVRVMGPVIDETKQEIVDQTARSIEKSHNRLAVNYKVALPTVAKKFPPMQDNELKPLSKLFTLPPYDLPNPPAMDGLLKDLNELLAQKHTEATALADPNRRLLAQRQLMALHLDSFGLEGLLKYVAEHKPAGAPADVEIEKQLAEVRRRLGQLASAEPTLANVRAMLQLADYAGGALMEYNVAQAMQRQFNPANADASVDSELALLPLAAHELAGAMNNPAYWRLGSDFRNVPLLITARIDGPTVGDARRLIDAAIEAEKTGLKGNFYIDAGGKVPQYDEILLEAAQMLTAKGKLPVVLDKNEAVMQPDSAPDAALYVGWYSLRKYVPAFKWLTGSVGWHVASWEAKNLRDPNSPEWCVKMIQNGVAATIGAVEEPYLNAFPLPQEFFPMLMTGKWTLAECYWRTSPTVSWRMTLIGDPLYNPFAASPAFDLADLPQGLAIPDSVSASPTATP